MTLITLISGQLAPNLFSVLQLKPSSVKLVHTVDTKQDAVTFQKLITEKYGVISTELIEVPPFNPEEIGNIAEKQAKELGDSDIILNYTGGTKPMAIQFVRAFDEVGAKLLYVDTQQEYLWWSVDGKTTSEKLVQKISVPILFELQNASIRSQTDQNRMVDKDKLTSYMYDQRKDGSKRMKHFVSEALDIQLNNKPEYKWQPSFDDGILRVESDRENSNRLSVSFAGHEFEEKKKKYWLDYFTGSWFEYWTYSVIKKLNVYNDVRCNVTVNANDNNGKSKIKSEIDVIAIKNGIPLFIECKSGKVNQKSITNLNTISDEYGSKYSEKVIVSFYPVHDEVLVEKIRDYNIELIEGPENIKEKLEDLHNYMVIRT